VNTSFNQLDSLLTHFDQWVSNDRAKWLALLIQRINDFELAEDCLQEAVIKAFELWKRQGVPANPENWILRTAYNKAIDQIRRHTTFQNKKQTLIELSQQQSLGDQKEDNEIPDERLKLIFTCCHPALEQQTQIALTLNSVCGLSVEDVAQSFIVTKTTMAQRLVRAKRKIKIAGIPYQVPQGQELKSRLNSVLSVIYLIFNQGYSSQKDSCSEHTEESWYLIQTLNDLIPNQAEVLGLMALMLFHNSRSKSRQQSSETLVTLETQDRSLWDQNLISKANDCFRQAMSLNDIGAYQIQAAISGVHSLAQSFEDTDWEQICTLYSKLYLYWPSDTVLINHAVALNYNNQSDQALKLIQSIDIKKLNNYLPYHLAKAHILKSLNQNQEAINNLSLAMALSQCQKEKKHIQDQINLL
jgi:RNA polymerase sigma-70 factor (ECF subfamily)